MIKKKHTKFQKKFLEGCGIFLMILGLINIDVTETMTLLNFLLTIVAFLGLITYSSSVGK